MIYKNFSEKASECMILDFFPQLRRGKPHSEQKLRIPFRNCLEKQDLFCIFYVLHMLAKLLVHFLKAQVPLTFQIIIQNCLKLRVFMKTISKNYQTIIWDILIGLDR